MFSIFLSLKSEKKKVAGKDKIIYKNAVHCFEKSLFKK